MTATVSSYVSFEDWFNELEGFSLRSERFDGDVAWLRAAFDAGRTPPQNTDGEAVAELAWRGSETGDAIIADGYMIALDLDENGEAFATYRGNAIKPFGYHATEGEAKAACEADRVQRLPLVPASALSAMKAERDGLRTALVDAGRAVGGGLADTVSSDFLAHVPSEVRMVTQNLTARAETAEAERDALAKALEPFATFAEHNCDGEGWGGTRCERERIVDWFGPSEFRRARQAIATLQGDAK